MIQKSLTCLLILGVCLFSSCAEDDSENPQNSTNYFPLATSNSWDYQNTFTSQNQDDLVSEETLTVTDSSEVGGNTVYEFETSNPLNAAPTTLALSNGVVYKENSSLIYTGSFSLDIPEFPDINFEIEDGKIYDKNASVDEELFVFSNTIQEIIEGIPITIDYTISTLMGENFESLMVNNDTYEDVISSKLIVNMEISGNIGVPAIVLQNQKVVEVTNYFAKDIGLIKGETDTAFDFITLPSLPFQDVSFFTLQELESFSLNLD
jgi:hypothetical protein